MFTDNKYLHLIRFLLGLNIKSSLPNTPFERQNIHCGASKFSSLLLEAAKASILYSQLGTPKAWLCQEENFDLRNRRRSRSEAHSLSTQQHLGQRLQHLQNQSRDLASHQH